MKPRLAAILAANVVGSAVMSLNSMGCARSSAKFSPVIRLHN